MGELKEKIGGLKAMAKEKIDSIDVRDAKDKARDLSQAIANKTGEIKDSAVKAKKELEDKITELDRMLDQSITDYNDAYTLMNDAGMQLYVSRCRSVDLIDNIENLINSIANHPKSFDTDFEEIKTDRNSFTGACDFADREIKTARLAAANAGAGLAAGASVAFMGPTAAMWVATTFGTASTGTAISALSGAAATKAALAWIGGGALAAGGGGTAAGSALLALAGPIGWGLAGVTILGSIILFSSNKIKLDKQKSEEIESVKRNTETVKEADGKIRKIISETEKLREGLAGLYSESLKYYNGDYADFTPNDKKALASIVMTAKSLSRQFLETV